MRPVISQLQMMMASAVASAWEAAVSSLSPVVWLKCTEATNAALIANGNWGSGGGTIATDPGGLTFGASGVMPSDPSRPTILVASGGGLVDVNSLSTAVTMDDCTIYFVYAGTTGVSAEIPWRDNTSAGYFIRFDPSNVTLRIAGTDYTTSYSSASVKDGNPHLIGVTLDGSSAALWIDGTKVWTGSAASSGTSPYWTYLQNLTNIGQKLYGNHGDFFIYNSVLSDADNAALYAAWN